MTGNISPY